MRVLVGGAARGAVLRLEAPISLWGGVDARTGRIIEPRHPQYGEQVAGKILVLAATRGSSSSSTVLAELLRTGNGPAGIVLGTPDSILQVGSLVASHLYGAVCPILVGGFPGSTGETWEMVESQIRPIPPPVVVQ